MDLALTVPPLTAPTVDQSTVPPTLTGTSLPNALIVITDSAGNAIGETAASSNGDWSVELSGFPQADKTISLTQTVEGVTSMPFTTPIAVTIPSPGNPTVDTSTTPSTLSGTDAIPGATIHLTDSNGNSLGSAVVGPDGTWSAQLASNPADGIVQSVNGIDSLPNEFNLEDAPAVGVASGGFGLLITALVAGGAAFIRRRPKAGA